MATIPQDDPLLQKAREFTNDEVPTLEAWLEARLAGDKVSANRILQTGILSEHYRSLLTMMGEESVPITVQQLSTLDALRTDAKQTRDRSGYGA